MDDRFVNLGEEVILTMRWQSGASESATVCFVISLSICYWLLRVCACVRVCVRERERVTSQHISYLNRSVCVCVCYLSTSAILCLSRLVCVVCVRSAWGEERERERETVTSQRSVQRVRNSLNRSLFANTYEHHHCVCHVTLFPSRAWTD